MAVNADVLRRGARAVGSRSTGPLLSWRWDAPFDLQDLVPWVVHLRGQRSCAGILEGVVGRRVIGEGHVVVERARVEVVACRVGGACRGVGGRVVAIAVSQYYPYKHECRYFEHTVAIRSSSLGSLPSTLCSILFLSSSSKKALSSRIFMMALSSLTLLVFASSFAVSTSFRRRLSCIHFR